MPVIITKRASPCAACGGTIQRGEQAWHTTEGGTRHPEAQCRTGPARFRTNRRAGTCSCGARVAASSGRLAHVGSGGASRWAVRCTGCPA